MTIEKYLYTENHRCQILWDINYWGIEWVFSKEDNKNKCSISILIIISSIVITNLILFIRRVGPNRNNREEEDVNMVVLSFNK